MTFARFSLLLGTAAMLAVPAAHAAFPDRPVQLVVGFAPGGGADRVARLVAPGLSKNWGQQVIVQNKPGVGGVIATEFVAKAAPNGYTLLLTGNAHTVTPYEMKVPYDPIADFTPIMQLGIQPSILLVTPGLPAKNMKEFVALAKGKPGQLFYGTTGGGSPTNLQVLLLMKNLGIDLAPVTYKAGGDAVLALAKGEVQVTFLATAGSKGPIDAGQVRGLAITSQKRSPTFPDIPTFEEALGVARYDGTDVWHGLVGPKGLPADIVNTVRDGVLDVMKSPDFQKVLGPIGFEPIGSTPKEFGDFLKADLAKWPGILKKGEAQ